MGILLNLPYYYGRAGEQYAFFRIPKLLLTDERFAEVSTDAKLLYGLLLDRMELSYRNGWIDEQNRVFIIFTAEEVMSTPDSRTLSAEQVTPKKYFPGGQCAVRNTRRMTFFFASCIELLSQRRNAQEQPPQAK